MFQQQLVGLNDLFFQAYVVPIRVRGLLSTFRCLALGVSGTVDVCCSVYGQQDGQILPMGVHCGSGAEANFTTNLNNWFSVISNSQDYLISGTRLSKCHGCVYAYIFRE